MSDSYILDGFLFAEVCISVTVMSDEGAFKQTQLVCLHSSLWRIMMCHIKHICHSEHVLTYRSGSSTARTFQVS